MYLPGRASHLSGRDTNPSLAGAVLLLPTEEDTELEDGGVVSLLSSCDVAGGCAPRGGSFDVLLLLDSALTTLLLFELPWL